MHLKMESAIDNISACGSIATMTDAVYFTDTHVLCTDTDTHVLMLLTSQIHMYLVFNFISIMRCDESLCTPLDGSKMDSQKLSIMKRFDICHL